MESVRLFVRAWTVGNWARLHAVHDFEYVGKSVHVKWAGLSHLGQRESCLICSLTSTS